MNDAKIKKLILKFGPIGYAIYFHCLELIAGDISSTNLTFQLEHDSEIIADNLKIQGTSDKSAIEIVEEVMRYIISLGLFECSDDKIYCFKMLKRLDTSMTSNAKFRGMIAEAKDRHDTVMIGSCRRHDTVMQDKIRIDKNRIEYAPDITMMEEEYTKLTDEYDSKYIDSLLHRMSQYQADKNKTYSSHYRTALNWIKKDEKEGKAVKLKKKKTCPNCGKPWNGYSCHECLYESEESKNARIV